MPRAKSAKRSAAFQAAELERRLKLVRQWMAIEREAMEFRDFISNWRLEQERAAIRRREELRDRKRDAQWSDELDEILDA